MSVLPRAGPSLQTQEPRLQFSRKQVFHWKQRNQGSSFTMDWIGAVASRYFPNPHSLFSIWTDLKRSEKMPGAPTRRWGERIRLSEPSGLHGNSPQELNISSITVFDQIRDPEIPITLRPPNINFFFSSSSCVLYPSSILAVCLFLSSLSPSNSIYSIVFCP